MIAREDLVGTITGFNDAEYLIVELMGEGSTAVVYAIAPLDAPDHAPWVIKFYKPEPFLEMNVLHYRFRIHEARYPNHRLLMDPEERLGLLAEEMLERIASSRCEFRIAVYREIVESWIEVVAANLSDAYTARTIAEDFLEDPAIRVRVDENLLYRIRELLDEDRITEHYIPFFEFMCGAISAAIARWQAEGTYHPLSSNPAYNLLGLQLEGFISGRERDYIAMDPRFGCQIKREHLEDLFEFAAILYHRAAGISKSIVASAKADEGAASSDEKVVPRQEGHLRSLLSSMAETCSFLDSLAGQAAWDDRQLRGLARYWSAKALMLKGGEDEEVQAMLESALVEFSDLRSLPERHDVLMYLAALLESKHPERAASCMKEVQEIEMRLADRPPHDEQRLD